MLKVEPTAQHGPKSGQNILKMKKLTLSVLWRCWLGGRKGIRPVKN